MVFCTVSQKEGVVIPFEMVGEIASSKAPATCGNTPKKKKRSE